VPHEGRTGAGGTEAGRTLAALAVAYRQSAEFLGNAPTTQANQNRYLDMIAEEHGHRTIAGVRPVNVYAMRDAMQGTPGKANDWLSVFRLLMAFACRIDERGDNPRSTSRPCGSENMSHGLPTCWRWRSRRPLR
jgi:hypothetical protein